MRRATTSKKRSITDIGAHIRLLSMEMSARAKCGETGSSLSISDILAVLYFKILRINPKKPNDPFRDRFILSKGHAAAALYAALALRGFFPEKILEGHRIDGGLLHAHPSRGSVPGIEASTGSLGHGLSIGAGIAESIPSTSKVFVLLGDGECDEGSVWEAARYIAARNLKNIIAIVDDNHWQGYPLRRKSQGLPALWKAAGWHVFEVSGHDAKALEKSFSAARKCKQPAVVIADTVAGYGVSEIEHTQRAHYYVPDTSAVERMRSEI